MLFALLFSFFFSAQVLATETPEDKTFDPAMVFSVCDALANISIPSSEWFFYREALKAAPTLKKLPTLSTGVAYTHAIGIVEIGIQRTEPLVKKTTQCVDKVCSNPKSKSCDQLKTALEQLNDVLDNLKTALNDRADLKIQKVGEQIEGPCDVTENDDLVPKSSLDPVLASVQGIRDQLATESRPDVDQVALQADLKHLFFLIEQEFQSPKAADKYQGMAADILKKYEGHPGLLGAQSVKDLKLETLISWYVGPLNDYSQDIRKEIDKRLKDTLKNIFLSPACLYAPKSGGSHIEEHLEKANAFHKLLAGPNMPDLFLEIDPRVPSAPQPAGASFREVWDGLIDKNGVRPPWASAIAVGCLDRIKSTIRPLLEAVYNASAKQRYLGEQANKYRGLIVLTKGILSGFFKSLYDEADKSPEKVKSLEDNFINKCFDEVGKFKVRTELAISSQQLKQTCEDLIRKNSLSKEGNPQGGYAQYLKERPRVELQKELLELIGGGLREQEVRLKLSTGEELKFKVQVPSKIDWQALWETYKDKDLKKDPLLSKWTAAFGEPKSKKFKHDLELRAYQQAQLKRIDGAIKKLKDNREKCNNIWGRQLPAQVAKAVLDPNFKLECEQMAEQAIKEINDVLKDADSMDLPDSYQWALQKLQFEAHRLDAASYEVLIKKAEKVRDVVATVSLGTTALGVTLLTGGGAVLIAPSLGGGTLSGAVALAGGTMIGSAKAVGGGALIMTAWSAAEGVVGGFIDYDFYHRPILDILDERITQTFEGAASGYAPEMVILMGAGPVVRLAGSKAAKLYHFGTTAYFATHMLQSVITPCEAEPSDPDYERKIVQCNVHKIFTSAMLAHMGYGEVKKGLQKPDAKPLPTIDIKKAKFDMELNGKLYEVDATTDADGNVLSYKMTEKTGEPKIAKKSETDRKVAKVREVLGKLKDETVNFKDSKTVAEIYAALGVPRRIIGDGKVVPLEVFFEYLVRKSKDKGEYANSILESLNRLRHQEDFKDRIQRAVNACF